MTRRSWPGAAGTLAAVGGIVLLAAGCVPSGPRVTTASRVVRANYPAVDLVVVVDDPSIGPALARLIGRTAVPYEDLDVLAAGVSPAVMTASVAPQPASFVIRARPVQPGAGSTDFQRAEGRRNLTRWKAAAARAKRAATVRTRVALAAWARGLGLAGKVSRLPRPARRQTSLAAECGAAASALLRLGDASGTGSGGARVVVLYARNLAGRLPPGELNGDDVIVVLPYAPTAKAIGSATGRLIAAGAADARIEGTDTTPAQLAARVAADLSSHAVTDRLSGAALFGNGRARLTRGAARVLLPLIAPLRHPGASAVINGYASTTGRRSANLRLSYARAAAVAAFLEAHGVPASALEVVGHGSTGLVGPGASAANRRVVVIIEEPPSGGGTGR